MFLENAVRVKHLQNRLHQPHSHDGMKGLIAKGMLATIHSFILCIVM